MSIERTAHLETGAVNACRAVEVLLIQSDDELDSDNCTTAQLTTPN